jgi:uncharacterized protein (TIGR03790 family)
LVTVRTFLPAACALALFAAVSITDAHAQTPAQVLVVINKRSPVSDEIGRYYMRRRAIPAGNLCVIDVPLGDDISHSFYESDVEAPIAKFLTRTKLTESILYIVTTQGVPLRVTGDGNKLLATNASVDSELTLLYQKLHGVNIPVPGAVVNPFFQKRDSPFRHPQIPMYMVTRLAGYDMTDMKGLVDRAPLARNTGKFVIDLRADNTTQGNQWLRAAALLLPQDRVILDDTAKILTGIRGVIGYASWGSNDFDRKERFLKFEWLPGAIATEFVSTDARTFNRPPDQWTIGRWGGPPSTMFFGSPQSMIGDYIHEGASGAGGQVDEPYLDYCPRPDFVLPAWFQGRNLAESFYMGIRGLSWVNVVIGDPLMRLQ